MGRQSFLLYKVNVFFLNRHFHTYYDIWQIKSRSFPKTPYRWNVFSKQVKSLFEFCCRNAIVKHRKRRDCYNLNLPYIAKQELIWDGCTDDTFSIHQVNESQQVFVFQFIQFRIAPQKPVKNTNNDVNIATFQTILRNLFFVLYCTLF